MASKHKTKTEEEIIWGSEPEWSGPVSSGYYNAELSKALTWYRNISSNTDKKRWLIEWCKNNLDVDIQLIKNIPETFLGTLGAVCRMQAQGFVFNESDIVSLKDKILRLAGKFKNSNVEKKSTTAIPQKLLKDKKLSPFYTMFDLYIDGELDSLDKIDERLTKQECNELLNHYTKQLEDISENKDAYNNIRTLNKRIKAVIEEIKSYLVVTNITHVRRKRVVTKDKQVSKLKYLNDSTEYGVVSINPEKIIGANLLLVFNTKTRQIQVYKSEDGISVKGSTLQNVDLENSYGKTVRKPKEFLPNLTTKNKSLKLIDNIAAVEKWLTGRINKYCIILKAW